MIWLSILTWKRSVWRSGSISKLGMIVTSNFWDLSNKIVLIEISCSSTCTQSKEWRQVGLVFWRQLIMTDQVKEDNRMMPSWTRTAWRREAAIAQRWVAVEISGWNLKPQLWPTSTKMEPLYLIR
jgi:hypothetical protein